MTPSSATQDPDASHDFDDSGKETEQSILNRKRELKGLASSFSSNLGRRISPPYPRSASGSTQTSGCSVKSIVAWLELSSDSSKNSGGETRADFSVGNISFTESISSLHSQQTLQGAEDVEEYSLTLLKYKQYFTELPLGRCLDGQQQSALASPPCERVDARYQQLGGGLEDSNTIAFSVPNRLDDVFALPGSEYSHESQKVAATQTFATTAMRSAGLDATHEPSLFRRNPDEVLTF